MKIPRQSACIILVVALALICGALALADQGLIRNYGAITDVTAFKEFSSGICPQGWNHFARPFVDFTHKVSKIYLVVLVGLPLLFLLHFLVIGPKSFGHTGRRVPFYSLLLRIIHWCAAILFTGLAVTGVMIVFAKPLGGGAAILAARQVHIVCAYGFVIVIVPLFLLMVKDMLPSSYDIKWFLVMGGYLSREKRPVPAGRFNAGQKLWFWLATLGGAVMFYSGYFLQDLSGSRALLATYAKIHLLLGVALVALFITHLYMSLIGVKGGLESMISGYKWEEELRLLHSRMDIESIED